MTMYLKILLLFILAINCEPKQIESRPSGGQSTPAPVTPAINMNSSSDITIEFLNYSHKPIRLGDSFDYVISVFPYRPKFDSLHDASKIVSPNSETRCSKAYIRNGISDSNFLQISFYFEENLLTQVESEIPLTSFPAQMRPGKGLSEILKVFPYSSILALRESGDNVVGGADLVYVIDHIKGMGAEFRYSSKENGRILSKYLAFQPGGEFSPQTCVAPPQWLEPLTIASLENEAQDQ